MVSFEASLGALDLRPLLSDSIWWRKTRA